MPLGILLVGLLVGLLTGAASFLILDIGPWLSALVGLVAANLVALAVAIWTGRGK